MSCHFLFQHISDVFSIVVSNYSLGIKMLPTGLTIQASSHPHQKSSLLLKTRTILSFVRTFGNLWNTCESLFRNTRTKWLWYHKLHKYVLACDVIPPYRLHYFWIVLLVVISCEIEMYLFCWIYCIRLILKHFKLICGSDDLLQCCIEYFIQ